LIVVVGKEVKGSCPAPHKKVRWVELISLSKWGTGTGYLMCSGYQGLHGRL